MSDYSEFLASKRRKAQAVGFASAELSPGLYDHQSAIVRWACRQGRCAIFADTGLGKTRMQLEWARQVNAHTGGRVLLVAPLAVTDQTVAEAITMGIEPPAVINYERLHQVDPHQHVGIVLDESSILKSYSGKVRNQLVEMFARTPYRLAATATPAPNDHAELGNHAEFLGICTRAEMLAEYFVHDNASGAAAGWRLKGHAVGAFWEWVASWAVVIRTPADLGFDATLYDLPPLVEHVVTVSADARDGEMFATAALTLTDQRASRRATLQRRCDAAIDLARKEEGSVIVWTELNDESTYVARALGADAVEVTGSEDHDRKRSKMVAFSRGEVRCLVSKPKICGFGMNWQHCAMQVFVGMSHSFEAYYQAVRRSWRFGQKRPVNVYRIGSVADSAILVNISAKQERFAEMGAEVAKHIGPHQQAAVLGRRPGSQTGATQTLILPRWI